MKKIVGLAVVTVSIFLLAGCNTDKEQKRVSSISESSSEEKKKLEIISFKIFETDELGKAIITGTTDPNATVSVDDQKEIADEHGLFRIEYQLTEPKTKELTLTSKVNGVEAEKKIKIEPSKSYLRSEESSTSSEVAVPQPSSETNQSAAPATPEASAEQPQKDDQVGKVLVSPSGAAVTVLRVLPNGERVISEETSQADLNNDGILTFEELSQAENDLNRQTEEIRRKQLEEME
ncbi:hypothetical protein [Enterococcus raffinosus]|uniref:EF-hand domain-containing protein n=1 Tax=Enterococcus raffinosus TaxID=71452 RepID=A0AAW8TDX3_9ENTE|nr:hypothetical protein [Enterococcus raffinosus]MDT2525381.1 hypothetical protein [Enterococcus raffinosus]MDT2531729.1 hypothetical protein [Enterococcus raffinosus]MDT2536068.1 hypothetical protein [Enterococcus raffinosus]MDT2546444.1 hypothetical protein [Enterococcus raffinosus]MDT2556667.1 hypothetical protein [Enterococcus raffinosus]